MKICNERAREVLAGFLAEQKDSMRLARDAAYKAVMEEGEGKEGKEENIAGAKKHAHAALIWGWAFNRLQGALDAQKDCTEEKKP